MAVNIIQQLNSTVEKMPIHLQEDVLAYAAKLSGQHASQSPGSNGTEKAAGKALWAKLAVQMKELEANPPVDPFPVDYAARFDEIHYQASMQ